ncbi:hypothetical protein BKA93DRAFT_828035 [Sparassis latifolia]
MEYKRDTQIERKPRVGIITSVWNWFAGKEEQCESGVKREVDAESEREYLSAGMPVKAEKVKPFAHTLAGRSDAMPPELCDVAPVVPAVVVGRPPSMGPPEDEAAEDAEDTQPITSRHWYAVTRGLEVGVFEGWTYIQPLVIGMSGSAYEHGKSYDNAIRKFHIGAVRGTIMKLTAGPAVAQHAYINGAYLSLARRRLSLHCCFFLSLPEYLRLLMAKCRFTGGGTSHSKKCRVESITIPDIFEPPMTIQPAQSTVHSFTIHRSQRNGTTVHSGQVDADGWEDELHDVIKLESRDGVKAQTKNKKKSMSVGLNRWLAFRESYLEELLHFDGPGTQDFAGKCKVHHQSTALRCLDCFSGKLACPDCTLKAHTLLPLHRVQRWNGRFFERITLANLGLRVQLGHHSGQCFQNQCGPVHFTVLNYRWNEVSMVVRQWRHLKSIKRAGHGHDPAGIAATKPGACTCMPSPRRKPASQLGESSRLRAWALPDPELGSGWSYFVAEGPYQEYLAICKDQHEISTSESELNAVKQAYSKGMHDGLSVTGVVGVKCAHHCFVLPNGIGNLQKGERYCNVDYITLSVLKAGRMTEDGRALADIRFSYDIACNWYKNFYKRLEDMPEDMQILDDMPTCAMIPKAHIEGHGPKCRTTSSFNFLRGVGRTHGETVEQEWVHIGQVGISTREMGPAACHSVLDDHWSAWNWRKLVDLESHLIKHLAEALLMMAKQKAITEKFTSTFSPATIEKWCQMVAEWDQDKTKPDPYAELSASMMMAMIRLGLAEEEAVEVMRSEPQLHEKLTASARALRIKGEGVLRNPLKKATLQEKWNALTWHILVWTSVQPTYQPAVAAIHGIDSLTDTADVQIVHAKMLRLYLPSELTQAQRDVGCRGGIVDKEHRFRMAQVEDALEDVHRLRQIYAGLLAKYRINVADFASTQEPADVAQDSTSMEDSTALEDNDDHLHVEWAKTVTRADWWEEEWKTFIDEMRRSLESLTKKAIWWMAQGSRCKGRTDIVAGCCTYAVKQASIRLRLIQKWAKRWQPVLVRARITHGWIDPYLPASPSTANVRSPTAATYWDAVFTVESQNGSTPDADDPSRYGCDDSESDWADDDGPVEFGDARDDDGGFDSD